MVQYSVESLLGEQYDLDTILQVWSNWRKSLWKRNKKYYEKGSDTEQPIHFTLLYL